MSSYLINACMRQSPTPDAVTRKDFTSAAVTSHTPTGNDIMYRPDTYYYPSSRGPVGNMHAGFSGMHEKLLGGGGGGSIFQGYGDPSSPIGYATGGGLQYKPPSSSTSLHNGLRSHHDATAALTHRPPSTMPMSDPALVDDKSPVAMSPPLSSPGSSPPLAESDQGGSGSAPASDGTVTAVEESSASSQQQQSPTEPLIYPWMRRVHSGHGGKLIH